MHGAFMDAGLVDKVLAFVAPVLLGGGPAPTSGLGAAVMAEARRLRPVAVHRFGGDVLIEAYINGA